MAKMIACTGQNNAPLYINLNNVLIIDQPGKGAHFKFVSDASITIKETLDEVIGAIRAHEQLIDATNRDDDIELTMVD